MHSLNIDYVFNRVYDVLLWIKYTWLFTILRNDQGAYIDDVKWREWDGLRDRGWFSDYLAAQNVPVPPADVHLSLWQKIAEAFGYTLPDSDGDGIPDVSDPSPYDSANLSKAALKERYQSDYTFGDHLRDFFGIAPKDTDKDGVPDSYESAHHMDPNNPDTDRDGLLDGQELALGTDPLNNDTDGDGVIDGRDEAPLDPALSSTSLDTDGDGVSDVMEQKLGTDIHLKDTDGDGIPDGMDTYPLDPNNIGQISSLDLSKVHDAVHFSIQNPLLSFFADTLSVLVIALLLIFVYAVSRWLTIFLEGMNHYEHHFHHNGTPHKGHAGHVITDGLAKTNESPLPEGLHVLPVHEGAPSLPPLYKDFVDHPKFAVIQGYMSSESEALWRIGIMEADNVLLETLTEKGYQGDTLAEKLKGASFKTIDLAWDAHKVRNRIAHEGSDFQLTEREAKRAFMLYESVFRDLKIIR